MLHSWERPKTVLGSLRPCLEVMVESNGSNNNCQMAVCPGSLGVIMAAGFPCDHPGELLGSLPGYLNAQWRINRDGTWTKPSTAPRQQRMLMIFWAICLLNCDCL